MEDTYQLLAHVGENESIEIAIDKLETFDYERAPGERAKVTPSQVWDTLEPGEKYFVLIEENFFGSNYEMERLYGY